MKTKNLVPTGAIQSSLKNHSKKNGTRFFKRKILCAAVLAASPVVMNNTYATDIFVANGDTETTTQTLSDNDALIINTGGAIDIALSGENGVTGTGANITIDSNGSIATDSANGISVVNAGDADITIGSGGTISSLGDNAYGVVVGVNSEGASVAMAGLITTTGDNSKGILVDSGVAVSLEGFGTISTIGENSDGVLALSGNNMITLESDALISTSGQNSHGIVAAGSNNFIDNNGSVSTLGAGAVGIYVDANIGSSTVLNNGEITTDGNSAHGIEFVALDGASTNNGSIITGGGGAFGILMTGFGGTYVNSGEIITGGDFSHGIFSVLDEGIIINDGIISTSGNTSMGITSIGPSTTITNTATIGVTGEDGAGIGSGGIQDTIANNGAISTTATGSVGILTSGEGVSISNSGSISTAADLAHGIYSLGVNADISNSGSISTEEVFSYGIVSIGDNATIENSGSIEVQGNASIGIYSGDANNITAITVTDEGSLKVTNTNAVGIYAGAMNNFISIAGNVSAIDSTAHAILSNNGSVTLNLLSGAEITGAIDLGDNSDSLTIQSGVTINDDIELGAGVDTVTFDQSIDGIFSNNIYNAESIFKINTGTLTLNEINVYGNATTTINQGTIVVNGSTSNSLTFVNAEGILSGSGTVGTVRVNSGTIAPGNSIGTTTVSGDIIFTNGGAYITEVDAAGNSDLINVTGTATLTSGAVIVEPGADNYQVGTEYEYTILTAAGGLGDTTFDTVSSTLAFLTPTLNYDNNNVYLTLVRDVDFESAAETPTQLEVAITLTDAVDNNEDALDDLSNEIVVLTNEGAQQAFDSLSGVQHTYSQLAIHRISQQFGNVLSSRSQRPFNILPASASFHDNSGLLLAYNGEPSTIGIQSSVSSTPNMDTIQRGWWIHGFGGDGEVDGDNNFQTADYGTTGLVFGVDTDISIGVVGIAASFANTDVETFNGNLDINTYQLALYGQWKQSNFYIDSSIRYGMSATDVHRRAVIGTLNEVARSNYDTDMFGVNIEAGTLVELAEFTTLRPYIGVEYNHLSQDGFIEVDGDSINLLVNSADASNVGASFGARLYHDVTTKKGLQLKPYLDLAYVRDEANLFKIDAHFAAVSQDPFRTESMALDKNRIRLSFGLMGYATDSATFNVGYTGEFASSDNIGTIGATARFSW